MPVRTLRPLLVGAAIAASAGMAQAIGITDATRDYVAGISGSKVGDLDVIGAFVTYNLATDVFVFTATLNADIGSSAGGFYVWGVDRGSHVNSADFASHGYGGVLFDSVVFVRPNGTGNVTTFFGGGGGALAAGSIGVFGSTIIAKVPGSMLPSTGSGKTAYGWNLWPRDGTLASGFAQISDFAPDNSDFGVTVVGAVPEPASVAMLLAGLGLLGATRLRRRQAVDRG